MAVHCVLSPLPLLAHLFLRLGGSSLFFTYPSLPRLQRLLPLGSFSESTGNHKTHLDGGAVLYPGWMAGLDAQLLDPGCGKRCTSGDGSGLGGKGSLESKV